jgi:hypothetical protein
MPYLSPAAVRVLAAEASPLSLPTPVPASAHATVPASKTPVPVGRKSKQWQLPASGAAAAVAPVTPPPMPDRSKPSQPPSARPAKRPSSSSITILPVTPEVPPEKGEASINTFPALDAAHSTLRIPKKKKAGRRPDGQTRGGLTGWLATRSARERRWLTGIGIALAGVLTAGLIGMVVRAVF